MIETEVPRQTVQIDGCTVSYLRAGSGPPLLFLHGSAGIARWLPWMQRLAASYDVIAPDHPGWGRSDVPGWLDNIHDLAYFYLDFLRTLGLERVHLVGHSIGGWLGCEIAVRDTSSLTSLTLVAPAGLRAQGVQMFDIFLASAETGLRAAYNDQAYVEQLLAQPVSDEQMDINLRNRYATARVGWQPRLFDPHLHKWLHRIDVPTLVIWGADDRIVPVAHSVEFTSRIPGAREATIPACGHVPQVERQDAFVELLETFLRG